jgi:hypothetical protein
MSETLLHPVIGGSEDCGNASHNGLQLLASIQVLRNGQSAAQTAAAK